MHKLCNFLLFLTNLRKILSISPYKLKKSQCFSVFLLLDPFGTWTILLIAPPPLYIINLVKSAIMSRILSNLRFVILNKELGLNLTGLRLSTVKTNYNKANCQFVAVF